MQPKGLLKFLKLEGFVQNLTEYVENKVAITKLEYKQKLADMLAMVVVLLPVAIIGLFAFLFLNIGAAMALNVWLDSRAWGFVIIGALYLVIAIVLFTQREAEWLKKLFVDGTTKFLKEKPKPAPKAAAQGPTFNSSGVKHKKIIFEDEVDESELAAPVGNTTVTEDRTSQPVSYGGQSSYNGQKIKEPKLASEVTRYQARETESSSSIL